MAPHRGGDGGDFHLPGIDAYTDDLNLTLAVAVAIVRIPEDIRGYGYAKERHLATASRQAA